jgi:FMN phosphatase YigB (HAD superfamily)
MNKKGIVLFDIDRTIFDSEKLGNKMNQKIKILLGGVSDDILLSVKKKYMDSLKFDREYSPENYINVICSELNFKKPELLNDVYYGKENIYEDCVFPDAYTIFEELRPLYDLGIFSEGTKKFQNHKFASSGLKRYFDPELVFIFDNKSLPKSLNLIPNDSIIVDDKESVCEYLTKANIKAIWLNKKDDRISNNFQTIHNLLELKEKLM